MLSKNKKQEDIVAFKLSQNVFEKNIILSSELNEFCKGVNKSKVLKKLKKQGIIYSDNILKYDSKFHNKKNILIVDELKHLLCNDKNFITNADVFRTGTRFYRGIVGTGFPEYCKEDWIENIISNNMNMDFSFFVVPEPCYNLEKYLKQKLKYIEDKLYLLAKQNISDNILERKKKDIKEKLKLLSKEDIYLYNVSFYTMAKGVSEKETRKTSEKIISLMNSDGIEAKYTTNYQKQLFNSLLPIGVDNICARQIITLPKTLRMGFPFREV